MRQKPTTVSKAAEKLAALTGTEKSLATTAIRATLLAGANARNSVNRAFFAFRLHQFLSKGGNVFASPESPSVRAIETNFQVTMPGPPSVGCTRWRSVVNAARNTWSLGAATSKAPESLTPATRSARRIGRTATCISPMTSRGRSTRWRKDASLAHGCP